MRGFSLPCERPDEQIAGYDEEYIDTTRNPADPDVIYGDQNYADRSQALNVIAPSGSADSLLDYNGTISRRSPEKEARPR